MASASVSAPTTRGFRSAKRVSDKRLQPNSTAAAKPVTYAFWGRARRQQDAPARSDKIAVMPRISEGQPVHRVGNPRYDRTGPVRLPQEAGDARARRRTRPRTPPAAAGVAIMPRLFCWVGLAAVLA